MRTFYIIGLLLFANFSIAQEKSILFIGNSYTAANNLPLLMNNIAMANGHTIVYDNHIPGGSRFEQHKTNPIALEKIRSREWDHIVLQDQSQIPALPIEIIGDLNSPENAMELNTIIKDHSPCTEVVFYMTWGRKSGDADFCVEYPPVCTYAGMQDELSNTYLLMADENDATVAPVGEAWRAVINDDPDLDLYVGDGSHPNINGSYLAACVMYATIFQTTCLGTTYTADIDEELATYLQTKADEIVFGTPETWRIGSNDLFADIEYEETTPLSFSFSSLDTNATTWEWTIDETNYTIENPTHTFPSDGLYNVELIIMNDCDTSEYVEEIYIGGEANVQHTALNYTIYPNPSKGVFIITGDLQGKTLQIIDLSGRILHEQDLQESEERIEIGHLPRGIYNVRLDKFNRRIVKH